MKGKEATRGLAMVRTLLLMTLAQTHQNPLGDRVEAPCSAWQAPASSAQGHANC